MKRYLITLSLVTYFFTGNAQNWSLVMPNDTLVYESVAPMNPYLHTVWVDSIISDRLGDVYYMNRIAPGIVIDTLPYDTTNTCVKDNWFGSNILVRELTKPQFCGAKISRFTDRWEIDYSSRRYVIFPKENVGSIWLSDSISGDSMMVLAEGFETINLFGIMDSVKSFQFQGETFKLSKNYGFIDQIHLGSMYPEEYELVGVHNRSLGVVIPMGEDFFHYNVGDKFYRFEGSVSSDGPNGSYFKRKVTEKSQVGDTLIYEYGNYEIKYWPNMNPMLNAFPNTLSEVRPIFIGNGGFDSSYLETLLVQVNLYQDYHGEMVKFNSEGGGYCLQDTVLLEYEITGPFCDYTTGLEPRYEGYNFGLDTYINNLNGYVKDGIVDGDTTLSVKETIADSDFKIYPNPVLSQLHIEINSQEPVTVGVYNMIGQLLDEQQFYNEITMDVTSWGNSLVLVVVRNQNGKILTRKKVSVQ